MLCREIAATGSGCICVASQFRKKYWEIVCCLTRSIILWHKSNYLKIINTIVGIIIPRICEVKDVVEYCKIFSYKLSFFIFN